MIVGMHLPARRTAWFTLRVAHGGQYHLSRLCRTVVKLIADEQGMWPFMATNSRASQDEIIECACVT